MIGSYRMTRTSGAIGLITSALFLLILGALALVPAKPVAAADCSAWMDTSKTPEERVRRVYQWTLGRTPSASEIRRASEFLATSPLSELCRALMNVNEFVYLD